MRKFAIGLSLPLLGSIALLVACVDASLGDRGVDAGTTSAGDSGASAADSGTDGGPTAPTFAVSGTATYDYVNANDDVTQGGVKLDYAAKTKRPIRRASVFAMDGDAVVTQTVTNDLGAFTLDVPNGKTIKIRVAAQSVSTGNVPDATMPNNCNGAKWDVMVVDNTSSDAQYVLDDATAHATAATGISVHAPLTFAGGAYTSRAAAPFAILDTIIAETELLCQGKADVELPQLLVKWSVNNVGTAGDATTGMIGTSHYGKDVDGGSELQILGKEDVDTDEFDDHIIAHEFGHYLEDRIFRTDTVGDTHGDNDILYPSVAFGEGFGNALSCMTFNDPVYVDTSGIGQAEGATIDMDSVPTGDNRGVYSEASVQNMLWKLFDNRNSFDRIFNILLNFQKTTPGITSALTFGAYYNQVYGGAAESFKTLWESGLDTPFDALCSGACVGTGDTADVFDVDNDIGNAYAATRKYPGETGAAFGAEFWRVSRLLTDGTNTATAHDQTDFGGYEVSSNKLGAQRAYRYVSAAAGPLTVSVGGLGGTNACTDDVLDMKVALLGKEAGNDREATGDTAGCPSVTFNTEVGKTYTIVVNGITSAVSSYGVVVARKSSLPFRVTAAVANHVAEETDVALPIVVTPTRTVTNLKVSVRGIDGVVAHATPGFLARPVARAGILRPAIARVSRGAAGFAVVDVSATLDGRRVSASYPIPLASNKAYARKTLGAVTMDASGRRVERMQAVVR